MPTCQFLLELGQSNAQGANVGPAPAGIPNSAIQFIDCAPGTFTDDVFKPLDRRATGHYGPELTMGLDVLAYLPAGDVLILVKVTKGSTSIAAWLPGDGSGLYDAIISQLDKAIALATAAYPGYTQKFYTHWCIGETDAAGAVAPTAYAADLNLITEGIRAHVGQAAIYPVVTLTNAAQTSNTQLSVVRAQEALCAFRLVDLDDVGIGPDYGGLHYSATPGGQQLHGSRAAAALRDVIFMGSISDDLANKGLDHVLGGGDYTRLATVYLAAFKLGVESAQIARKAVTNNATNFPSAAGTRTKLLAVTQTFVGATADAGDIDEIRIYTASSGGLEMARDAIAPVTVNNSGQLEIAGNDLSFTFAAGSWSDYAASKWLDHVFGGSDYTRPSNVYLGGCSADPQTGGSMITDARKLVTNNATNWPAAASRSKVIGGGPHDHNAAPSNIGTVSHVGIWDALTSGNLLFSVPLTTPRVITTGQVLAYRTGEIVLAIAA